MYRPLKSLTKRKEFRLKMGLIDETELKKSLLLLNCKMINKIDPSQHEGCGGFWFSGMDQRCQCNIPFLTLYLLFPFSSFSLSCSASLSRYSSKGWVLDQSSFFVLIDSNIQRFKDLLEVRMFPSLTRENCFWALTETHHYTTTLWN